jgi:hypothetical protein
VNPFLASARRKLARGEEHMDALREQVASWDSEETYRIVSEDDPKSDWLFHRYRQVVHFTGVPLPDFDEWSVLTGDCLYEFRCVLDHLIWGLSVKERGDPPPKPRRVSFPIYKERELFKYQGLHAVAQDVRTDVEALQPYHARENAEVHPLWVLHELSNIDKHRLIPVVDHYAVAAEVVLDPDLPGAYLEQVDGRFEDGAVLSVLSLPRRFDTFDVNVKHGVAHGVVVSATQDTPMVHLGMMMEKIKYAVGVVLEEFEAFF